MDEVAQLISRAVPLSTEERMQIGTGLIKIKATLPHGLYTQFLEIRCQLDARRAQYFVKAAKEFEGKTETVSHLPAAVTYYIARKDVSVDERAKIIEAGKKQHLTLKTAKALIRPEKDPAPRCDSPDDAFTEVAALFQKVELADDEIATVFERVRDYTFGAYIAWKRKPKRSKPRHAPRSSTQSASPNGEAS
jgi:hypothetical protein